MKDNNNSKQNDTNTDFNVLECPEIICAGRPFSLKLEIIKPTCIKIKSDIIKLCDGESVNFDTVGVYELNLICDMIVNDFTFTLKTADYSVVCSILRSVEKPTDDHIDILKNGLETHESCCNSDEYLNNKILSYLKYMHGFSEIGSKIEPLCLDFYRYVLSHTRTGSFYSSFALISDKTYLHDNTEWDILNIFYPSKEEVYFLSPTPKGTPILTTFKKCAFENYKAISFTGYNKPEERDLENLLAFVQTGGTLIAGWPHLSIATNRKDIESGKLSIISHKLVDYLCADANEFISDTYCGNSITVCPNVKCDDVIATTDSGYPLAFIKRIGLGQVFFINAMQYPAHNGVRFIYEAIISEVSDNLNSEERIFLSCGKDIAFTVYDQKDGARHIYVLAVDWHNDNSIMHHADLRLGKQKYKIDVPFGSMMKIVAKDSLAAWSEDEAVEVLLITGNVITLQGYGKTKINIAKNGEIIARDIDFTHKPIQAIQI